MSASQDIIHNHHAQLAGISREEFQIILAERKAERKRLAQGRRLEGVQKIKEHISKDGIDPLELFPEEIWRIILAELDFETKIMAYQVHPLFRNLMEEDDFLIRDILFPQILDLNIHEGTRHQPHRRRPLALNFNIREVSKSLRDTVDIYYEKQLMKTLRCEDMKMVSTVPTVRRALPGMLNAREIEFVESFFTAQSIDRPKRLYCRSFEVKLTWSWPHPEGDGYHQVMEFFNQKRNAVTSFLEEVGQQILRFRFICSQNLSFPLFDFYSILREWLPLLPNLKWLEMELERFPEERRTPSSKEKESKSKTSFTGPPAPTIHDLERIDLCLNTRDLEVIQICEEIVRANRHIKILQFHGREHCLEDFSSELVKSLELETFGIGATQNITAFKLGSILQFVNVEWKLKQIHLRLCSDKDTPLNEVFDFLEKFPTLERVTLKIAGHYKFDRRNLHFLQLPNLQHLEMDIMQSISRRNGNVDFIFSLQFLIYCSKLKTLRWIRTPTDINDCFDCMISFGGGWKDLSESNIWDVFPCLERVVVKHGERRGMKNYYLKREYHNRHLVYSHAIPQPERNVF